MKRQYFNRYLSVMTICVVGVVSFSVLAGEEYGHESCESGKLEYFSRYEPSLKAYDEATGRDLRNFPPDRLVDYLHLKLQLRFEDLSDKQFTATETLTFVPIGNDVSGLTLDAVGLQIHGVRLGNRTVEYSQNDEQLMLRFEATLPVDKEHELVIEYTCTDPYDGMVFTPASSDAPEYTPEVHTQGQTDTNRHWFVCHDFPNERVTSELIVDVPAGFSVSSNGSLVSNLTSGDRAVWHWLQDKPHVFYLVSLVIGKFDIVDISHERVPMKVWAPVGLGHLVEQTYGRTGEMIDVFEQRFGVPYPWDRYDQLIVKNFAAGGMENTAATTMYPTAILDEIALKDRDLESLIAHELAHQWTGDYFTCKSWEHIWLNEGWATFGSALWFEHRDGEEGYLDSIRRNFSRVAEKDKTTNVLPMVSPIYEEPFETFRRKANPYPKGASILHMLRMMLGEDVFWKGVHVFLERHGLGVVETSDFRYVMEEVSGRGLEWFFEQWCYRPGIPELDVTINYDGLTRELFIDVRQTQEISERTPAFRFTLPIQVNSNGDSRIYNIEVLEELSSFRTVLDGPPRFVAVDPYLHVLKSVEISKPLQQWIDQSKSGPTIIARHQAVEALGDSDTPDVVTLLSSIVRDNGVRYTLRQTAVESLAGLSSKKAKDELLSILKQGIAEPRVRLTIVEQLKNFDKNQVSDILANVAGNDESYATREAAIKGLAELKATEHADLIAELVHFNSQHDKVRRAALDALAELDDRRGMDLAIQYAAYGVMDRTRPDAVNVVGRLAKHDADRAFSFLSEKLNDVEWRTVRAAGEALAEAGDKRGIAALESLANTHRDPDMRKRTKEWLDTLNKKLETEGEKSLDDDSQG